MTGIDTYLARDSAALSLHAQRLDLIASNIANSATPGFKARDIDFASAFKDARETGGINLAGTNRRHLKTQADAGSAVKASYRVPNTASLDGNTVELGTEQVAFAENAARYEATLGIMNGRIQTLMSAIRGE